MSDQKMAKTLVMALLCSAVWCGVQIPAHAQEPAAPVIGQTRERGKCTDTHSKEWCKAHGYGNNRPVGETLPLTTKQRKCIYAFAGDEALALAKGLITLSPSGAALGTAIAIAKCWWCFQL